VQLKGMAVDDALQGSGLGALLVERGMEHARGLGATLVWARARDSALYFYERRGFAVEGDGFIDEPTAMPHHIVTRRTAE
jgi:GNAT superfamily N-acetyltransferase